MLNSVLKQLLSITSLSLQLPCTGFNATGVPSVLWDAVEPYAGIGSAADLTVLTVIIIVLSNLASNVPTVLLLGPRLAESTAAAGVLALSYCLCNLPCACFGFCGGWTALPCKPWVGLCTNSHTTPATIITTNPRAAATAARCEHVQNA